MTPERNTVTDAERTPETLPAPPDERADIQRTAPPPETPSKPKRRIPRSALRFAATGAVLAVSALFVYLAAAHPAWIADSYVHFSRGFQHAIGAVSGILPFSVAEFAIYAVILGVPAAIIACIVLAKKRGGTLKRLAKWLSHASLTASILLAVFLTTWGVNYYSAGLAYTLGLEVTARPAETLAAALGEITSELREAAADLPRDESGEVAWPSFSEMSDIAADAWLALAESEPYFADVRPNRIKPIAASRLMSYTGLTGVFVAVTGEANVNADFPDPGRIFTMAHELAHSFGAAPENEANFAAFLACRASSDPFARYSGYLSAFVYCYNALVSVDRETAFEYWYQLPDEALRDLRGRTAYWQSFEGEIHNAATSINDAYLKTMAQPDGVKSYGMVVDLILADYVARIG